MRVGWGGGGGPEVGAGSWCVGCCRREGLAALRLGAPFQSPSWPAAQLAPRPPILTPPPPAAPALATLPGTSVALVDLADEQWRQFGDQVAKLATQNEKVPNSFVGYQSWLRRHGPFNVLFDGANIALFGQNYEAGGWSMTQAGPRLQLAAGAGFGSGPGWDRTAAAAGRGAHAARCSHLCRRGPAQQAPGPPCGGACCRCLLCAASRSAFSGVARRHPPLFCGVAASLQVMNMWREMKQRMPKARMLLVLHNCRKVGETSGIWGAAGVAPPLPCRRPPLLQ